VVDGNDPLVDGLSSLFRGAGVAVFDGDVRAATSTKNPDSSRAVGLKMDPAPRAVILGPGGALHRLAQRRWNPVFPGHAADRLRREARSPENPYMDKYGLHPGGWLDIKLEVNPCSLHRPYSVLRPPLIRERADAPYQQRIRISIGR
jgi:hypothetical protein